MRRFAVLVACAAAALSMLGACGSGSNKSSSNGSVGVALDTYDNSFKPAQLTAQAGKKITVVLKNEGTTLHNFSIDALGVSKDVQAGKKVTVSFTPSSAGSLSFFCKYHQALGMTGTVAVSG